MRLNIVAMKPNSFSSLKNQYIKPVSNFATEYRHIMAELDPALLQQHPSYKLKGRWRGKFTIAAWVRFPEGLSQRVSLLLVYRDGERRKNFRIDSCRSNRQTLILLNGNIDLDFSNDVCDMVLVLEGLSEDSVWILDEFRIESAGAATPLKPKSKKTSTLVSV